MRTMVRVTTVELPASTLLHTAWLTYTVHTHACLHSSHLQTLAPWSTAEATAAALVADVRARAEPTRATDASTTVSGPWIAAIAPLPSPYFISYDLYVAPEALFK